MPLHEIHKQVGVGSSQYASVTSPIPRLLWFGATKSLGMRLVCNGFTIEADDFYTLPPHVPFEKFQKFIYIISVHSEELNILGSNHIKRSHYKFSALVIHYSMETDNCGDVVYY